MRQANSEVYIRKKKVEKDCKRITRKFNEQRNKNTEMNANVMQKMRKLCDRETAVAVSAATVHLQNDLKQSQRGVASLKHHFAKSEVYISGVTLSCFILPSFVYISLFLRCIDAKGNPKTKPRQERS